MRVVVLGSGTLEPEPDRGPPAHVVVGDGFTFLLDCGAGVNGALARAGLSPARLTHVALTHFHVDHVGGLPALFWALEHGATESRAKPLTLLGPPGTGRLVDRLGEALGDFMRAPGGPLRVVELDVEGHWSDPASRFDLVTVPTPHTTESVAYRIDSAGSCIGYTGDTGEDEDVGRILGGSDVVICECARADDDVDDRHLGPAAIVRMFARREPGLLVTTHVYGPLDPERVPDLIRARGYDGLVVAGRDGLDIRVEGGRPHIHPE